MSRKAKILFLLAAMPVVLWLFYSHTAYWHFHITHTGIVVEHSHPYKNNPAPSSPFQKHNHADFEYAMLAQMGNISSIIVYLLILIFVLHNLTFIRSSYQSQLRLCAVPGRLRLRAPPAYDSLL